MRVVDFVGREIKPGCTIVYPVRRGSSMWLNQMKVQQIVPNDPLTYLAGYNTDGRVVYVHNLKNVIVVVPVE